jgi:hypothetical protein
VLGKEKLWSREKLSEELKKLEKQKKVKTKLPVAQSQIGSADRGEARLVIRIRQRKT